MITIGTSQTWAYINAQLDYPYWKRVRVHIIQDGKTLCHHTVGSWWETDDVESIDHVWMCSNCQKAAEKQHRIAEHKQFMKKIERIREVTVPQQLDMFE